MNPIHKSGVRELSEPECLALLATTSTGRLGVTHRVLPAVVPVRIELLDKELSIESLLGSAIPLVGGAVVVLEAGTLGDGLLEEWAVEVWGFLKASDGETFSLSIEAMSGWHTNPISSLGRKYRLEDTNGAGTGQGRDGAT
jgi:hypothetical protein